MRKSRKRKGVRRGKTNRLGIISIAVVVLLLSAVLSWKISVLHGKNNQLSARKSELQILLDEQYEREKELEEQRIYVQTKKYIEEKAKDLGYIYPDEIIFKPIK